MRKCFRIIFRKYDFKCHKNSFAFVDIVKETKELIKDGGKEEKQEEVVRIKKEKTESIQYQNVSFSQKMKEKVFLQLMLWKKIQEHPVLEFVEEIYLNNKNEAERYIEDIKKYNIIHEVGPDHDKMFTAEVLCDGKKLATGTGRSKKNAEMEAARKAIENARKNFANFFTKSCFGRKIFLKLYHI